MLEIIPAIDLRGGQAVRLKRGDFGQAEKVADDPIAVARSFEAQGAQRLHVVDLDGARTGAPQHPEVVAAIIRAVSIPVQVGGGIQSVDAARAMFELGADRIVAGTSAARDEATICALLSAFGERIVVGADVAEGYIAVQAWQERTGERAEEFGQRLVSLGACRFLFTDIARDGMLEGLNAEATRAFARAVGVPVIASGGVAGIDDVKSLWKAQPDGVEGVIIGKALYAGRLTLLDALRAAASED